MQRSWTLIPEGAGPSSSGMTRTVVPEFSLYLREAALPATIRIGKSHRLGEELVFGASQMQLDPHATIEARFGKQQVAARGPAARDRGRRYRPRFLVECRANACCRRRLDLDRREARAASPVLPSPRSARVIDHVAAEHHDVGRLKDPFLRTPADERAQLLLGAIYRRRRLRRLYPHEI